MSKAPRENKGKAPVASIPTNSSQSKKNKKRKRSCTMVIGSQFKSAIKRIAKKDNKEQSVFLTSHAISILCAITNELIDSIGEIAGEFSRKVNKQTIGSEEIDAALEVVLKGELKKLALKESRSALTKQQVNVFNK